MISVRKALSESMDKNCYGVFSFNCMNTEVAKGPVKIFSMERAFGFLIPLLRYKSRAMQFTRLKHTNQWHAVYLELYILHHNLKIFS